MAEDTGIDISDSVVMGGVQQNITNVRSDNRECSSCGATNVVIMKCQEENCTASFCQICHPYCRFFAILGVLRFDSGEGTGPFCETCLKPMEQGRREYEQLVRMEQRKTRQQEFEQRKTEKSYGKIAVVVGGFFIIVGIVGVLSNGIDNYNSTTVLSLCSILCGLPVTFFGLLFAE